MFDNAVATLGELVREKRAERGLSQSALGGLVGVDGQTISNLEMGRTKALKLKNLRKLAEVLGIPIEKLTSVLNGDLVPVYIPRALRDALAKEAEGRPVDEYVAAILAPKDQDYLKNLGVAKGLGEAAVVRKRRSRGKRK